MAVMVFDMVNCRYIAKLATAGLGGREGVLHSSMLGHVYQHACVIMNTAIRGAGLGLGEDAVIASTADNNCIADNNSG